MIPDVELTSDVAEAVETVPAVNYSEKTLAELVKLFEELAQNEERMKMSKEAEAIKAAFYKRLAKEKAEAGITSVDIIPDEVVEETAVEEAEVPAEADAAEVANPFVEIEKGFKEIYNKYRKERAEYNRQLEKEREQNLALKEAVIADLKALLEKQEDVNETFPEFREIQNRWRAVGPVPAQSYRNINETYQLYVEQFYDMVKINRELRDLDFKKNLEAKEKFCEYAEKLAENPNVVEAFRELQKLHEQWKEFGPVAKEYREQIWDRFKAATAVINKKYQGFFEGLKEQQTENLAKKTVLCEKVEEIAEREVANSNEWNAFSKEIEEIQKEWKTIGPVPRKNSDAVWKRFLAACDYFFEQKEADFASRKSEESVNLEKKKDLIERIKSLQIEGNDNAFADFKKLLAEWNSIGHVPFKEKDNIYKKYKSTIDEVFDKLNKDRSINRLDFFKTNIETLASQGMAKVNNERKRLQKLVENFNSEIATAENNIGFFSKSKGASPLLDGMKKKISKLKDERNLLLEKIRLIDETTEELN